MERAVLRWNRCCAATAVPAPGTLAPLQHSSLLTSHPPNRLPRPAFSVPDPERVLGTLRSALAAAGLDTVVIFSGGVDVDILPSRASKGKALSFLLKQVGRPPAAGDGAGGNDFGGGGGGGGTAAAGSCVQQQPNVLPCPQLEEKAGSLPAAGVMVCGDSGNDIELFAVPGKPGASSCQLHCH